jgi:hypothetical protein
MSTTTTSKTSRANALNAAAAELKAWNGHAREVNRRVAASYLASCEKGVEGVTALEQKVVGVQVYATRQATRATTAVAHKFLV